jgi:hypothetical protein
MGMKLTLSFCNLKKERVNTNAEFVVTVHGCPNKGNVLIIIIHMKVIKFFLSRWVSKMVPVKTHHCAARTQLQNKNLNSSVSVQISPLERSDTMFWFFLEQLRVMQLIREIQHFCETWRLISIFTKVCKWTLLWSIISFLIFQHKLMYIYLVSPHIYVQTISSLLSQ